MNTFKLLMPHEVIDQWESIRGLLVDAVDMGSGELEVDDIKRLILNGRMYLFASDRFAVTAEFVFYPRKTVMVVGFGAGQVPDRRVVEKTLTDFAERAGASSIQTYCKNPAMVRYYRRWFHLDPVYTVLEKYL